jgi:hypothetical protein
MAIINIYPAGPAQAEAMAFEAKDAFGIRELLKARGYTWNADPQVKSWIKTIAVSDEAAIKAEAAWAKSVATTTYRGRPLN